MRPILSDKCYACHGPDEKHRAAKLRLDVAKDARRAIEGQLLARITSKDESERMPPKKANKPLNAKEVDTLRRWIPGAKWSAHWAYVSPKKYDMPEVKSDWPTQWTTGSSSIGFKREKLRPLRRMRSPCTLVRRLYFDLTVCRPRRSEVDAFLKDSHPYEKLVDQACSRANTTASGWRCTGSTWCATPTRSATTATRTTTHRRTATTSSTRST